MTDLEIAAKFREAADYLREHGWCQGQMHDGGRSCLVGGLGVVGLFTGASGSLWTEQQSYRIVRARLGIELAYWNDMPGRTAEEVIALLQSLADDIELKAQIAAEQEDEPEPTPAPVEPEPEKELVAAHA